MSFLRDTKHPLRSSLSPIIQAARQLYRDAVLSRALKGKRVLIIGSGPSASELAHVPDDVVVCACNLSPRLLAKTGRTHIAVYSLTVSVATDDEYRAMIEETLRPYTIGTILTQATVFAHDTLMLKQRPRHVLYNRAMDMDGYYLRKLIGVEHARAALALGTNHQTSNGVGLIQHALYYKANAVYLIGVDMDGRTFLPGSQGYREHHQRTDLAVARALQERFSNIFCASRSSPLIGLFPYRNLAES